MVKQVFLDKEELIDELTTMLKKYEEHRENQYYGINFPHSLRK